MRLTTCLAQAASADGGSFTHHVRSLQDEERLELGSPTLSTEWAMPYVSVGNAHRRVFAGLLWSGAWSASLYRRGDQLQVSMGLPAMSAWATPGRSIEGPHALVGVTWDLARHLSHRFQDAGRAGRAFPSWTTFNGCSFVGSTSTKRRARATLTLPLTSGSRCSSWMPDGIRANSQRISLISRTVSDPGRSIATVSRLALPVWPRQRAAADSDSTWIEPERVALQTVGYSGLAEERFLAQQNGAYQPGVANEAARDAQICLADAAARAWVLQRSCSLSRRSIRTI